MVNNPLKKKKSKRTTLHHKYKVEKRVRQHHRKIRRDAKKNPSQRPSLKKDPGIPNLWPFKDEMLRQLETKKQRKQELEEERKKRKAELLAQKRNGGPQSIAEMQANASRRGQEFDENMDEADEDKLAAAKFEKITGRTDNSRRAYYREFRKVIENADVILEVLDARDPLGCRAKEAESFIMTKDPSKRIILVLNKIDLVPRETVDRWLKYLRNEFPCVAFKSSTQSQRTNLSHSSVSVDKASTQLLQTSDCLGASTLMHLLKNYARNKNIKTGVRVGIIGYPNVGKSSIINSLKRARVVGVGATPGLTKSAQEIYLDKHVRLFDSPGIVFASGNVDADIILRNAIKIEQIEDPITPVESIVRRCRIDQLISLYQIARFRDAAEFLMNVALKLGKLRKGGIPDLDAAARSILNDWNSGRIPFFTEPPEETRPVHVAAEVVSAWSKEFDIDNDEIKATEQQDLAALADTDMDFVTMAPGESGGVSGHLFQPAKSSAMAMAMDNGNDDDEDDDEDEEEEDDDDDADDDGDMAMDDDDDDDEVPQLVSSKKKSVEEAVNPQTNKALKKLQKQRKRDIRRGKLQAVPSVAEDTYDFAADYVPKHGDISYAANDDDDDDEDEEEDEDDQMFDSSDEDEDEA